MATVVYSNEEDDMCSLVIDGEEYVEDEEGWIAFCESEMVLTDGSDLELLDTFKLWGEQLFGWFYYVEKSVYEPNASGRGGHFVRKSVKKRLINKQYLIISRSNAKSLYESLVQAYFLTVLPPPSMLS